MPTIPERPANLIESLQLMAEGWGSIFIVIFVIIVMIYILQFIGRGKKHK